MKLQYVNIHGQPITQAAMTTMASIGKQQAAARRKQPDSDKPAGYHKGWRVIGFSPERVQAAREGRERTRALALKSGSADIPPPIQPRYVPEKAQGQPSARKAIRAARISLVVQGAGRALRLAERTGRRADEGCVTR